MPLPAGLHLLQRGAEAVPREFAGDASGFLPHGYCFLWNEPLLWTHVISDALIGLAYVTISFSLAWLIHRARRDIPFSWAFVAFGLFIITCGFTHFMEVWTFWQPVYWLSGGVKVVTAVASVGTAVTMPFVAPRVHATVREARLSRERELAAARAEVLEQANRELTRLNAELETALAEARAAQAEADAARQTADAARQTAEAANRAKAEFLAVMSHELRTPLNAILGYSQLLDDGLAGPLTEAQRGYLARTQTSAQHLLGLITQVLDFARVEAGRDEVRREPVDASQVVREAVAFVEPAAGARGLALVVEGAEAPVPIRSDAQKLRQIVVNLVSNAVKYTERGSVRVRLTMEPAPPDDGAAPTLRITVADTGIGIAPEHLEKIFTPFWQGQPALTRTHGGTGLGLSVSRRLANLLGGTLTVASRPGEGSEFELMLRMEG